jgi:hypothetical protein
VKLSIWGIKLKKIIRNSKFEKLNSLALIKSLIGKKRLNIKYKFNRKVNEHYKWYFIKKKHRFIKLWKLNFKIN